MKKNNETNYEVFDIKGFIIPISILILIFVGIVIVDSRNNSTPKETWMIRCTMFDQSTVTDTIQKDPLDKFYYKSGCISVESNNKQYRLVKCGVESFKANLIWP